MYGMIDDMVEMQEELEFLRFFFEKAENSFGAGSPDIYTGIMERWMKQGKKLPKEYKDRFFGEDDF